MNGGVSKKESGFTLIEILASMSIGIVLIYMLSETLAVTQTGWSRANLLGQVTKQESRTTRILRQTLTYMLPPAPDAREHTLIVSNQTLEFFTLPPQSRSEWGLMHVRLIIEPEGNNLFALVLNLVPSDDTLKTLNHSSRHVLLSGLAWGRFSYYYEGPNAVSVGQARNDITPELVVVNWAYPDSVNDIHELAVRPRMDLSGRCLLDLTSGTCREF